MGWQRERINTRLFRLLRRRGRRGHISLFDVSLYSSLVRDGGRIGSCNRDYPAHRVVIVRLRLTLDSRCPYNRFSAKYPTCALISSLPPRSTAGQLTLDQHIGVRIPGGQPNPFNNLRPLTQPQFPRYAVNYAVNSAPRAQFPAPGADTSLPSFVDFFGRPTEALTAHREVISVVLRVGLLIQLHELPPLQPARKPLVCSSGCTPEEQRHHNVGFPPFRSGAGRCLSNAILASAEGQLRSEPNRLIAFWNQTHFHRVRIQTGIRCNAQLSHHLILVEGDRPLGYVESACDLLHG